MGEKSSPCFFCRSALLLFRRILIWGGGKSSASGTVTTLRGQKIMRYIADLHIHSPYSRATSKSSDLAGLHSWARIKGIGLVGTGDFTHPAWFAALREQLTEAEPGFFRLKEEQRMTEAGMEPEPAEVRFLLSAEISSIYKRGGKVRKIHNLLYVPSFADAARINAKLAAIGNIESDGRPILGLDSRDLLEILLENSEHGFLVPAHIWTPWFSLFGSKSGFDSLQECFGDLSSRIFALETGLSSDPPMNRLLSQLDRYRLISNSDCHSPGKLGREANFFDTGFDFFSLRRALAEPEDGGFRGTIEFFPEEGKYHYDGHRKCGVCLNPEESRRSNNLCPVCGRPLTIGVHHRVLELADRKEPELAGPQSAFESLIPLPEVLGEIQGRGPATKGVLEQYRQLINRFGSEFDILLRAPVEELSRQSPLLGEAIRRMRQGEVLRHPGYDGEFGVIRVFAEGEIERFSGQTSLFAPCTPKAEEAASKTPNTEPEAVPQNEKESRREENTVNAEQRAAIESTARHTLVTAGPGTGKTYTLVLRLLHLLGQNRLAPQSIAVITFTKKAAEEIAARISAQAPAAAAKEVFVGTFHAFCLFWLRKRDTDLQVVGPEEKEVFLRRLFPDLSGRQLQALADDCADYFENFCNGPPSDPSEQVGLYLHTLEARRLIDLDGVIPSFLEAVRHDAGFAGELQREIGALLIDEFQDVNRSQYELTMHFAKHAEIFAIGDPDQSIYGFRGSNPQFFRQFGEAEVAGQKVNNVALTRNYRNAPIILAAARALIANNADRANQPLAAQRQAGGLVEYHQAASPTAEAQYLVQRIEEIVGGISHFSIDSGRGGEQQRGRSFADIGVLFRLNQQAETIRDSLEKRGIPCQLVGLPPFFMAGELRLLSLWILALADLASAGDYLRLFGALDGIGAGSLGKLEDAALQGSILATPETARLLEGAARTNLGNFLERLRQVRGQIDERPVTELAEEGRTLFALGREAPETDRFLRLAGSFGSDLSAFAAHLQRNATATVYDEKAEAVTLLTIHAAKGLEFDTVFIVGCEEGITPHSFGKTDFDLEEERRLFYVAMTRAGEQLLLLCSRKRQLHGRTVELPPSRFIGELPKEMLTEGATAFKARKPAARQLSLF